MREDGEQEVWREMVETELGGGGWRRWHCGGGCAVLEKMVEGCSGGGGEIVGRRGRRGRRVVCVVGVDCFWCCNRWSGETRGFGFGFGNGRWHCDKDTVFA